MSLLQIKANLDTASKIAAARHFVRVDTPSHLITQFILIYSQN